MSKHTQYVRDTLAAIHSVKERSRKALEVQDFAEFHKLMGDLAALKVCLVSEAGYLIDDLDKKAA